MSEYDKELVYEILSQVRSSAERILRRFEPVQSPEDFTLDEAGLEKLDAICMQLIAIGESLKNLDKITQGKLLSRYPEIEWKKVKGLRDIISHHYFDVNAEAIFDVCQSRIGFLSQIIEKMIKNLA